MPGLTLRGSIPGPTEVDGGTFVVVPRTPLTAACSSAPPQRRQPSPSPSAAAAEDQLRAHQARGDERPSALPPRPAVSPSRSSLPACARSTSAATRPPAARTPPTWSSAARRRRRGAAALCRPGASMARLSRFKQKLAGECCWSIPLPQASCAAKELICRRAGRGASSGPEKLRPEEAARRLDTKAGGEGQGGRGAGVRPGCGAGVWRNVRTK